MVIPPLPPSWIQRLWIQRVTGSFSIVGSSLIIYIILLDRKRKLSRPYHRIMLLMSVFDVIQSISIVFSYTAFPLESGFLGAKGNSRTCVAQSFFLVLGYAVPLYSSCLNVYYVLTIRYNISSEQFARLEPILHGISILIPFSMAIVLNTFDDTAPLGLVCLPRGNLSLYTTSLLFGFCFMFCITSMTCICWTVTLQAKKMKKYTSFESRRDSSARRSRVDDDRKKTIQQAFLYFSAFILTYMFPLLGSGYTRGKAEAVIPNTVIVLIGIFYPIQGFWNFVFYIRPGVQRTMKANPSISYFGAAREVIFNPTSVETTPRHASASRRVTKISSRTIVQTVSDTVVISTPSTNASKDTRFSVVEIEKVTKFQESLDATSFTFSDKCCESSESSECSIINSSVQQRKVRSQSERKIRRNSLVSIASVLNGEDDETDLDDLL